MQIGNKIVYRGKRDLNVDVGITDTNQKDLKISSSFLLIFYPSKQEKEIFYLSLSIYSYIYPTNYQIHKQTFQKLSKVL